MMNNNISIIEKRIGDMLFAGFRFKAPHSEINRAMKIVAKKAGLYIAGAPMALYHDKTYSESESDIEAGFPVKKPLSIAGINCRPLKGGRAVTIIHAGSYETIGNSYQIVFQYINEKKLKAMVPSREIYLKGAGILFKGNPKKYLTEIQIFIR